MLNQNFIDALKLISQRFNENNILWAVIGSTNLALQGIQIVPNDIDIIVTIESLVKIKDIFPEYKVFDIEEKIGKEGGAYSRVLMKDGEFEIEMLGEKQKGIYAHRLLAGQKINVILDDVNISCLALESELEAYRETGRQNRVDLIESFLLLNK